MVVGESAGLGSGRGSAVLTHGRNEYAVAEGGRPDLERLEECWSRGGEVDGLAGRVFVHRSEVGDVGECRSGGRGCGLVLGHGAHLNDI